MGFVRDTPKGQRLRCEDCGAKGYDGGMWMDNCRKGHPFQCDGCPRVFSTMKGKNAHWRHAHRHGSIAKLIQSYLAGSLLMAGTPLFQPKITQEVDENGVVLPYFDVKTFGGHVIRVSFETLDPE